MFELYASSLGIGSVSHEGGIVKNKEGKEGDEADAFFWKHSSASQKEISPSAIPKRYTHIINFQSECLNFAQIKCSLDQNIDVDIVYIVYASHKFERYYMHNDFLCVDNKHCLPRCSFRDYCLPKCSFRDSCIIESHPRALIGHFGIVKKNEILHELSYWPKLRHHIGRIIESCTACLRAGSMHLNRMHKRHVTSLIKFAYNRSVHSSYMHSPLYVVYDPNSLTSLNLCVLPRTYITNKDATKRAKITNTTQEEIQFEVGDWIWLNRWNEVQDPELKKNNLQPRGDDHHQVVQRIGNDTYQFDLLGEYSDHVDFNFSDLSSLLAVDDSNDLRTNPFEGGGYDADITTITAKYSTKKGRVAKVALLMPNKSFTRTKLRQLNKVCSSFKIGFLKEEKRPYHQRNFSMDQHFYLEASLHQHLDHTTSNPPKAHGLLTWAHGFIPWPD